MTLTAITLDGARTGLDDADIDELRRAVRGEVVAPGEPRYEEARRVVSIKLRMGDRGRKIVAVVSQRTARQRCM